MFEGILHEGDNEIRENGSNEVFSKNSEISFLNF